MLHLPTSALLLQSQLPVQLEENPLRTKKNKKEKTGSRIIKIFMHPLSVLYYFISVRWPILPSYSFFTFLFAFVIVLSFLLT